MKDKLEKPESWKKSTFDYVRLNLQSTKTIAVASMEHFNNYSRSGVNMMENR